ncbi:MAG: hypothetical protein H7301_12460 [Cryobacterium sp.]|nr:hypothetical protein [Oligoflexia bacterium]
MSQSESNDDEGMGGMAAALFAPMRNLFSTARSHFFSCADGADGGQFAVVLALSLFSIIHSVPSSFASQPDREKSAHCRAVTSLEGRKKKIASISRDHAVVNWAIAYDEGLFHSNLCWWQYRMARSALYLAYFSTEARKPTSSQAKEILSQLARMETVVRIPGFASLGAFTSYFPDETVAALGDWQKRDIAKGIARTTSPLRHTFYRENKNQFRDF